MLDQMSPALLVALVIPHVVGRTDGGRVEAVVLVLRVNMSKQFVDATGRNLPGIEVFQVPLILRSALSGTGAGDLIQQRFGLWTNLSRLRIRRRTR